MLKYPNHKPLKTLALNARMKYIALPTFIMTNLETEY